MKLYKDQCKQNILQTKHIGNLKECVLAHQLYFPEVTAKHHSGPKGQNA